MTSHQSDTVYAALGDSMCIDEYAGGPGRGAASLLLRNRDDDFPAWTGRDLASRDPRARMRLLACDGATTVTVASVQLATLRLLGLSPTLATVTMGGNDLLVAWGDPGAARRAIRTVIGCGGVVLAGLRDLMTPEAPILVGTVYDPSDGTGDAGLSGLPPWPDVLEVLEELNFELRVLAAEYGAIAVDLHARFLGHGFAIGDPAQSDARPADPNLWYRHLIEPNAWGANEIRAAFWEALDAGPSAALSSMD